MKKKLNVLVLSPHADDAELGMGGTIAKLVKQKNNVTILTAILPKENLSGRVDKYMENKRYKEQINSSKLLGAKLQTLNLDPYDFKFNREYVKIFDEKIKKIQPDVIFSCWEHDTHQDHKTLANIIFSVSRKNNISLYMYEAMLPGGINTNAFNPQLFIDISEFMKTKIKSINCYKSVFQRKKNNYSNFMESITARAKFRGEMIGVKYAECFVVVKKIEL
tara:strand:+ start:77 stop:736 length:660 start_codon:yes stop_codon:yes gene_type:complete